MRGGVGKGAGEWPATARGKQRRRRGRGRGWPPLPPLLLLTAALGGAGRAVGAGFGGFGVTERPWAGGAAIHAGTPIWFQKIVQLVSCCRGPVPGLPTAAP